MCLEKYTIIFTIRTAPYFYLMYFTAVNIKDKFMRFSKFKTCYYIRLRGPEFCHACEGGNPSSLAQGFPVFACARMTGFS